MAERIKLHYKKPIITRIKLDPEQAILDVCKSDQGNGAWMEDGSNVCTAGLSAGANRCNTVPRGSFGGYTVEEVGSSPGS